MADQTRHTHVRLWLGAVVTLAALGSGAMLAIDGIEGYLDAPIQTVRIEGDLTAEERAAVRRAVVVALNSPNDVLRSIVDLGWARNVEVRRAWPRTLEVSVTKETLAARWGQTEFLTTSGRVVAAPDSDDLELPHLEAVVSDGPRAMRIYRRLSEALVDSDVTLAALSENALGEWRAVLDNGITLSLGADDLVPRLRRFLLVYEARLAADTRPIEHVDARYESGVAVQWGSDDAEITLASSTVGVGNGH